MRTLRSESDADAALCAAFVLQDILIVRIQAAIKRKKKMRTLSICHITKELTMRCVERGVPAQAAATLARRLRHRKCTPLRCLKRMIYTAGPVGTSSPCMLPDVVRATPEEARGYLVHCMRSRDAGHMRAYSKTLLDDIRSMYRALGREGVNNPLHDVTRASLRWASAFGWADQEPHPAADHDEPSVAPTLCLHDLWSDDDYVVPSPDVSDLIEDADWMVGAPLPLPLPLPPLTMIDGIPIAAASSLLCFDVHT